jgi:iron complex outermembrane receptor protein
VTGTRFLLLPALAGCACALLGPAACPAAAQVPDSVPLDTLHVEVARTGMPLRLVPAAVSVITRNDIARARLGAGLDEALAAVPGVHIANRENMALGSRVTLRGFGARAAFGVRGVRIIADGIPLTLADGQSNLTNLDLGGAARIEVLRGAASALYGNAAGGVILVRTASPAELGAFGARVVVGDEAGRSMGALTRIEAAVSTPLANGGLRVGASHLQRDGVRAHAAAEVALLNAQLVQQLAPATLLRLVLNAAHAPMAENPGSLPFDSARQSPRSAWPNNVHTGSGEEATQVQGGAVLEHTFGARRATVSAWGAHRALENPIPVAFIEIARAAGGARAQLDHDGSRIRYTLGLETELQRDDRYEWSNEGGARGAQQRRDQRDAVTTVAPFAGASLRSGRMIASVGARYDRVAFATTDRLLTDGLQSGSRTLSAFSPSAALLLDLGRDIAAYANAGRAFQTPTTTELANAPPPPGTPCCPAGFNASLEPERTVGGELGLRAALAEWLDVDAAVFYYRVRDAIVPFQVEGIEERSFFRNAGRTRHRGLELAAVAAPIPRLRLRAALTRLDVRFVDDGDPAVDHDGNHVPGIPPVHVFAEIRWRGPVSLELEAEHTRGYFANDANTPAAFVPAATVLGARAYATVSVSRLALEPFAAVRNLTDERYIGAAAINAFGGRFFEPAAGRMILLGAGVRMTTR